MRLMGWHGCVTEFFEVPLSNIWGIRWHAGSDKVSAEKQIGRLNRKQMILSCNNKVVYNSN